MKNGLIERRFLLTSRVEPFAAVVTGFANREGLPALTTLDQ
jgi:hypothetical protein